MMHEQGAVVGQSLTIFLLLRVAASSAGYKRALDDASVVYSEQLVGEHSSNSTKIDTNLFSTGQQKTYDDCLAAVTNLHACLTFMLKEGTSSYVVKRLEVLFMTLADYRFESWFNYHASNDVTWLCHSVLIDVHNYFRTMVSMAMHPDNQSKALKNETITVSAAIPEEQLAHAHTITKWDLVTSQNSLSSYSSEPSTYAHFKPKETSNKKKKDERDGGAGKGNDHKNDNWGRFNTPPVSRASDPNRGLIEAPNKVALWYSPKLPSGKRPCHAFICLGSSCSHGRHSSFTHVSTGSPASDLETLHRWATSTSGINWVGPSPRQPGQNYTNNNINNNNNRIGNEALNPDATGSSGPTTPAAMTIQLAPVVSTLPSSLCLLFHPSVP
jgi:hypothetical protein